MNVTGGILKVTIRSHESYSSSRDSAEAVERRKLDLYLPDLKEFPLLVWFHGGGLVQHSKESQQEVAEALAKCGVGIVVPDYRLSPQATYPAYIEDAAAAVAWVRRNLADIHGDPERVFVGGHSAGGYLALMLAMDDRYLKQAGVEPKQVAGYISVSGQTLTHFTIREERGLTRNHVIADDASPIYYTRAETQPICLIVGDQDFPSRLEENALFLSSLKTAGNRNVHLSVIRDRDHATIRNRMLNAEDEGARVLLSFIRNPLSAE